MRSPLRDYRRARTRVRSRMKPQGLQASAEVVRWSILPDSTPGRKVRTAGSDQGVICRSGLVWDQKLLFSRYIEECGVPCEHITRI